VLTVEKTDVLFADAGGDSVASPGDELLLVELVAELAIRCRSGIQGRQMVTGHENEALRVDLTQGARIVGEGPRTVVKLLNGPIHLRIGIQSPNLNRIRMARSVDFVGQVTVDAETVRYDQQENVILASGGVVVKRPGTILTAEKVRVNRSTYDGEAAGRVVLRTEGTVVRGDYVSLNLADETGWIEDGEIEFPATRSEYVILGERMSKGFGQNYRVRSGVLTTCRCGGLDGSAIECDFAYSDAFGRSVSLAARFAGCG